MNLSLTRDVYRGSRVPKRRSINIDEHNNALAKRRGMTEYTVRRLASEYEPAITAPYFTLLSSPIDLGPKDCE